MTLLEASVADVEKSDFKLETVYVSENKDIAFAFEKKDKRVYAYIQGKVSSINEFLHQLDIEYSTNHEDVLDKFLKDQYNEEEIKKYDNAALLSIAKRTKNSIKLIFDTSSYDGVELISNVGNAVKHMNANYNG